MLNGFLYGTPFFCDDMGYDGAFSYAWQEIGLGVEEKESETNEMREWRGGPSVIALT